MKKTFNLSGLLLPIIFLFAGLQTAFTQTLQLPGDGKWYKIAQIGGQHGYIEYIYNHATGNSPSIAKGEIQFINSRGIATQRHQTNGYGTWNQPQFALIHKGDAGEIWVKATNGVLTGAFTIIRNVNATLTLTNPGDANLADNGGTLVLYDKLPDDSHVFNGNLVVTNGKVGIGTIPGPTTQLAVEGLIGARSIQVLAPGTAWPDFVFAKTYSLRPLSEVESFIKATSHLPEVPSAAQVAKDGINLGEMDAILLKKIEELTLYMIELKKENEELRSEVNKLKK